jgi:uncharacterized membrane protein
MLIVSLRLVCRFVRMIFMLKMMADSVFRSVVQTQLCFIILTLTPHVFRTALMTTMPTLVNKSVWNNAHRIQSFMAMMRIILAWGNVLLDGMQIATLECVLGLVQKMPINTPTHPLISVWTHAQKWKTTTHRISMMGIGLV